MEANGGRRLSSADFVTAMLPLTIAGAPFLAAGFSDGQFLLSGFEKGTPSTKVDLGSPVVGAAAVEGGILVGCEDDSLHFLDTQASATTHELPEEVSLLSFEDEHTLQVGDIALTVHY